MKTTVLLLQLLHLIAFLLILPQSATSKPHIIRFRSPGLYPEGLTYDPIEEHFIVGAIKGRDLFSVSDAGVMENLVRDEALPENTSFVGLAVDRSRRRLLVAVQSVSPLPPFSALAAYDLSSRRRIFLATLPFEPESSSIANAVAIDYTGNAYVTNSNGNFIWKVSSEGEMVSVWSSSPLFTRFPAEQNKIYTSCGLNGIAYVNKGYFLVVQSNTGKLFKVDGEDGTAREVLLNKKLLGADGVAVRNDGVLVVVSTKALWFIKSDDSWGEGVVYDETALDEDGQATSVVVGRDRRVYVIYGRAIEGLSIIKTGGGEAREWFEIEEVRSSSETESEKIWIYVLIGLGLAYFLFWRFQMKHLVGGMDKKIN